MPNIFDILKRPGSSVDRAFNDIRQGLDPALRDLFAEMRGSLPEPVSLRGAHPVEAFERMAKDLMDTAPDRFNDSGIETLTRELYDGSRISLDRDGNGVFELRAVHPAYDGRIAVNNIPVDQGRSGKLPALQMERWLGENNGWRTVVLPKTPDGQYFAVIQDDLIYPETVRVYRALGDASPELAPERSVDTVVRNSLSLGDSRQTLFRLSDQHERP